MNDPAPCFCGSKLGYADCCRPFHDGTLAAPTAEALMRSRYSAFVCGNEAYLLATWHPDTRPSSLALGDDPVEWLGLSVVRSEAGGRTDSEGFVTFVARYRAGGREGALHERSHFLREQGRWYYRDGVIIDPTTATAAPGRNAPCPCGSGRKFKRCCGAGV